MSSFKTGTELYLEISKKLSEGDVSSGSVLLFRKGKTAILKKLSEELAEVWAAVRFETPQDLALELSQVWYYLILLSFYYPDRQQEFAAILSEADHHLPSSGQTGNLPKKLIHTCIELTSDDQFIPHARLMFELTGQIAGQNQVSLADIHSHL